MNPKISVIVPVYKAEKYLHRCVDGLYIGKVKVIRDCNIWVI